MLESEIMVFALLGIMTSATMGAVVTENIKKTILLAFQGAITGFITAIIWIALTSGLDITLGSLIIPIVISAGISYITIYYTPEGSVSGVSDRTVSVTAIGLFLLVFIVAWSAIPITFGTSMNAQQYSVGALDWEPGETVVRTTQQSPTLEIPILVTESMSSISWDAFSETPSVGKYLEFKLTLQPYSDWEQPYIKMGIYKDTDNNGRLSRGDVLWSDTDYVLETRYTLWRANCLWDQGQPTYGALSVDGNLLPVFHAKQITKTLDETGKTFGNTPENYVPQTDMMSWDSSGLKDQVVSYASVESGQTATIYGKAYCNQESIGNNFILLQTYDARTSNPFSNDAPLQEDIIMFEVTQQAEPITVAGIEMTGIAIPILIILGLFIAFEIGYHMGEKKIWI